MGPKGSRFDGADAPILGAMSEAYGRACPNCGAEIEGRQRAFCLRCGTDLRTGTAQVTTPVLTASLPTMPARSGPNVPLILGALFIGLAVVLAAGYMALGS